MESNWRAWRERAWSEARHLLGLETGAQIVLRALLTVAIVSGLLFWGSSDAGHDEIVGRAVALAFVVLMLPVVFGWQLISAPYRTERDARQALEAESANLRERLEPKFVLSVLPPFRNIERHHQPLPDNPLLHATTQFDATYLRLRADPVGDHGIDIDVELVALSSIDNEVTAIDLPEPVRMSDMIRVPSNSWGALAILSASARDNVLRVRGSWPHVLENTFVPGRYRLVLRASGFGYPTASRRVAVDVDWDGNWEHLTWQEAAGA